MPTRATQKGFVLRFQCGTRMPHFKHSSWLKPLLAEEPSALTRVGAALAATATLGLRCPGTAAELRGFQSKNLSRLKPLLHLAALWAAPPPLNPRPPGAGTNERSRLKPFLHRNSPTGQSGVQGYRRGGFRVRELLLMDPVLNPRLASDSLPSNNFLSLSEGRFTLTPCRPTTSSLSGGGLRWGCSVGAASAAIRAESKR